MTGNLRSIATYVHKVRNILVTVIIETPKCMIKKIMNHEIKEKFANPQKLLTLGQFHFLGPATVIATLIHYPCTVAIPGLAAWSAFLEWILPTM